MVYAIASDNIEMTLILAVVSQSFLKHWFDAYIGYRNNIIKEIEITGFRISYQQRLTNIIIQYCFIIKILNIDPV